MSVPVTKVGIISCSGEAIPEGTVSRLATRRVLELLRPDVTVTLCLPLFLAGNEGERNFARTHPTITVDGCSKQCAKWGTERHSGPVSSALVVSEILGTTVASCHCSCRETSAADKEAVWAISDRIAAEVDAVLAETAENEAGTTQARVGECACSSPLPVGTLAINGRTVSVTALSSIFGQCLERGIQGNEGDGVDLLRAVKVYHRIEREDEPEYQRVLLQAYRDFRSRINGRK